ncbi:FHA domain-containing protein [Bifidobacterium primatium]|uniref:FHA domain-containing protein n=2 Tax=Bifidobacterium TaxID=1678 RepID=A0A2M9HBS4_9BIFI|nr:MULTISPECIES: FHA domain-containing protein [Bifidobacterium]NEG95579.1 FHA domain-containing protein [Bifidobacterium sp. SMB2]NEH12541.1 FHA domain-containing protein [Bifidobacterium saimiriisciurei]PJM74263.1 FHA domain-containing protein [Bifidobacterium primatium]
MTELTFTVLKYGFLVLLWVFVWFAVRSLHRDVSSFSPKTSKKHRQREQKARKAATAPAPRPAPAPVASRPTVEQPSILVIIDGPLAGTTIPLNAGQVTLGRAASNSVVLDDEFVSSHHARVFQDPTSRKWAIEDLGSTNGTVVNNQRLTGAAVLPARVPVRIGATTFELR